MLHRAVIACLTLSLVGASGVGAADVEQLGLGLSGKHGEYLVDSRGRALYLFSKDTKDAGGRDAKSACHDACATAWPPVAPENGVTAKDGVRSNLIATITRKDGKRQVTYGGWPLYYWSADRGKGQATGQGVKAFGGKWHLVAADGTKIKPKPSKAPKAVDRPFKNADLKGPECVLYDGPRDRYLVSNINGKMREKDGNGFISLLNPDGSVEKQKWIPADESKVRLDAPKGMAIVGGELHVADIDRLRTFDAETGEHIRTIPFDGAKFLNDIAVGTDGTLYVTDTGTKDAPGAVYAVSPSLSVREIARGRDLHRPNGIKMDDFGHLVVVTFASDRVLKMTTSGDIVDTQRLKAGKLDGLVIAEDGSRYISSWKGKHIVRVQPGGKKTVVMTGIRSPAAFDIDTQRNRLLVPLVRANKLLVAPLARDADGPTRPAPGSDDAPAGDKSPKGKKRPDRK